MAITIVAVIRCPRLGRCGIVIYVLTILNARASFAVKAGSASNVPFLYDVLEQACLST